MNPPKPSGSEWLGQAAKAIDPMSYYFDRVDVERRILEGENRVESRWPGLPTAIYEVPRWRDRPKVRLKVEWARLKYRFRHI